MKEIAGASKRAQRIADVRVQAPAADEDETACGKENEREPWGETIDCGHWTETLGSTMLTVLTYLVMFTLSTSMWFHMKTSPRRPSHHGDLRQAPVDAAIELLRNRGPDALTLRCPARAAVPPQAAA